MQTALKFSLRVIVNIHNKLEGIPGKSISQEEPLQTTAGQEVLKVTTEKCRGIGKTRTRQEIRSFGQRKLDCSNRASFCSSASNNDS